MDPLSLAASVITVATVATQPWNAFLKLRGLHKAIPGRLHALNNEVVDIELVLHQVAVVIRKREGLHAREREQGDLEHLLVQAQTRLGELRAIVDRLYESCVKGEVFCFSWLYMAKGTREIARSAEQDQLCQVQSQHNPRYLSLVR